ncbi:TPA: hypothetical protein GRR81_25500 [Vibrio parahaemolyticus]|uniref:hypothetical protein n=1 Tax=Vibrio vulnificus TaxID=672 RepID=UPI001302C218|nr:hypothetical protein [Vibrio vulnificus]HAS6444404.1 hypothetical protein [Vibrio parahaemolyticus]EIV8497550.1 hypothetical protein [Vibrio vulnificus]ELV8675323.1 hypothetical protein [Vibrio vulnificus]MCA3945363.1 hypothetical protein [Vibrio vulnificus]MCU8492516.1 hypothetical protein [Vibrio vulnificus]
MKIKDLKVGDILFMRGSGFIPTSISKLTSVKGADFSHAAIYVGDGEVFDTIGNTKRSISQAFLKKSQNKNKGGSDIRKLRNVLKRTVPNKLGVARLDYNFSRQKMLDVCECLRGQRYTSLVEMIAPYSAHFDLKVYSSESSPLWFKNLLTASRNLAKSEAKIFKIYRLSRGNDRYCSSLAICCIQYYLGDKVQVLRDCKVDLVQLSPNDLFEQCRKDKKFKVFYMDHPKMKN